MPLSSGSTFGPYSILGPLGAGGMGAVYRARDARLGREIAIKVLPEEVAGNHDRLARFELEARSASQLNHPNIITIYEVGEHEATPYIAMELIDGRSLRDVLDDGKLPSRKAIAIAAQIADGLAAAHERGVVHRDLKPDNVMVTKAGHVKILDFGLAKLAAPTQTDLTLPMQRHPATTPGTVMGTVGYMSPEQASGTEADYRSDQFSFGAIVYEMLTGRRAFQASTSAETLTAIIRDEPVPIDAASVSQPMRWIVERCLSKTPDERYDSTRDLARDLARVRDALSDTTSVTAGIAPRANVNRRWILPVAVLATGAIVAAIVFLALRHTATPAVPSMTRLTFRRGFITSARFTPDGASVLYGAGWEGQPIQIFSTRASSAESLALPLPAADVLSISREGQLLVSLGRQYTEWFVSNGNLAEVPLSAGGAPRERLENVQDADWFPDGKSIAVAHNVDQRTVLEFPLGQARYSSPGWISHVRVSPDGEHVAFIDHPLRGDDEGAVNIMDRGGKRRTLTPVYASAQGLAWRPDGKEIWFTAADLGFFCALRAVTPEGKARLVYRSTQRLIVHDIAADGRVLLGSEEPRVGAVVKTPAFPTERDLSWLDCSFAASLSADATTLLINEEGEGSHALSAVFVRNVDGSPATRLGEGFGGDISPDGKWVVAQYVAHKPHLEIIPIGAGEPKQLPATGGDYLWPLFTGDGKHVYFASTPGGGAPRMFIQAIDGVSAPKAISPDGYGGTLARKPLSPDGRHIAVIGPDQKLVLLPIDGGPIEPVRGAMPHESALQFSTDGKSIFTWLQVDRPTNIYRLDLATGARSVWKAIVPSDAAGTLQAVPTYISADGQSYAYSYVRMVGDLFVVEGLR
jgi:eukaryotic-like serine/threonine-protein kinase